MRTLAGLAFDHVWMLIYHDPMFVDDRAASKRLQSIWGELLSLEGAEREALVAAAAETHANLQGRLSQNQAEFLDLVTSGELWDSQA